MEDCQASDNDSSEDVLSSVLRIPLGYLQYCDHRDHGGACDDSGRINKGVKNEPYPIYNSFT